MGKAKLNKSQQRQRRKEQKIQKLWKNADFQGSFSNLNYFIKALRKRGDVTSRETVRKALEKDLNYQTSRQLPKTFPRRKNVTFYFSERFEMDLGDIGRNRFLDPRSGEEKGRFFLLCIDVFSRKFMVKALTGKTGAVVLKAFQTIISELEPPYKAPLAVESDMGSEFTNKDFQAYLSKENIRPIEARGRNKARIAERGIRTFKKVLIPYLEANSQGPYSQTALIFLAPLCNLILNALILGNAVARPVTHESSAKFLSRSVNTPLGLVGASCGQCD